MLPRLERGLYSQRQRAQETAETSCGVGLATTGVKARRIFGSFTRPEGPRLRRDTQVFRSFSAASSSHRCSGSGSTMA